MSETWEQTKARLKKQGIKVESDIVVIQPPAPPVKREESKAEPPIKRFDVHKRSLPVGNPPLDKIVVFAVTKAEAEWWINHILKAKSYQDDERDLKTLIYYDAVPVDAQPKERSIYYNPRPVITEGERYFEFNQKHETDLEVDWK